MKIILQQMLIKQRGLCSVRQKPAHGWTYLWKDDARRKRFRDAAQQETRKDLSHLYHPDGTKLFSLGRKAEHRLFCVYGWERWGWRERFIKTQKSVTQLDSSRLVRRPVILLKTPSQHSLDCAWQSCSGLADPHVGELRIAFGPGPSLENLQGQRVTRLEMQNISGNF